MKVLKITKIIPPFSLADHYHEGCQTIQKNHLTFSPLPTRCFCYLEDPLPMMICPWRSPWNCIFLCIFQVGNVVHTKTILDIEMNQSYTFMIFWALEKSQNA